MQGYCNMLLVCSYQQHACVVNPRCHNHLHKLNREIGFMYV